MGYIKDYLALDEKVDIDDYVIVTLKAKSTSMSIEDMACALAAELSTGTWIRTETLSQDIIKNYGSKVIGIKKSGKHTAIIKLAFPCDDFSTDLGGIPQIMSMIAGNIFCLKFMESVRIEDVLLPASMRKDFPGPRFGLDGIRKILSYHKGPFIGAIVKPKIGLSPKQVAEYVYKAGTSGLTHSMDDENLVNQKFCRLIERTEAVAGAISRIKSKTGFTFLHAINISDRADRIVENAEMARDHGANLLLVDVFTSGFSALQALAESNIRLPLHVNRTMHGAMTRNLNHGISSKVFSRLVRIAGGDSFNIGSFGLGKFFGLKESFESQTVLLSRDEHKKTFPVCSGGIHPGLIEKLMELGGKDIMILAGGGISGHPMGIEAGAKAMQQAVEASMRGISADRYAREHKELSEAIELWGYTR